MGKIDWIETENPEVRFENNAIGRIKKEVGMQMKHSWING